MKSIRVVTNGPSNGASELIAKLVEIGVNATRCRNDKAPTKRLLPRVSLKWGSFPIASHIQSATEAKDGVYQVINSNTSPHVLNKLTCLQRLQDHQVPIVEFTPVPANAQEWLNQGERVYQRSILTGSSGDGITVLEGASATVDSAPLYTKGVKGKRREYRIHVFDYNGVKSFWVQQKLRRSGFKENSKYGSTIRNLDHGWIFAHNDIVPPKEQTIGAAVEACKAFSLNFGAVDIIELDKGGTPFVLEINTAPGLEGATVDFYANCIKESLNG